jgi:hypothetical protein
MGAPVPIRGDIPAEELRQRARQESNGRVACRLLALANALDGMPPQANYLNTNASSNQTVQDQLNDPSMGASPRAQACVASLRGPRGAL